MNENRIKRYLHPFLKEQLQNNQKNVFSLVLGWDNLLSQISGFKKRNPSRHCRLINLSSGKICIEADHPGWIQLLRIHERELLKLLQEKFEDLRIKGIYFKLFHDSENWKSRKICEPDQIKESMTEEEKTQMEKILQELEAMIRKRG